MRRSTWGFKCLSLAGISREKNACLRVYLCALFRRANVAQIEHTAQIRKLVFKVTMCKQSRLHLDGILEGRIAVPWTQESDLNVARARAAHGWRRHLFFAATSALEAMSSLQISTWSEQEDACRGVRLWLQKYDITVGNYRFARQNMALDAGASLNGFCMYVCF